MYFITLLGFDYKYIRPKLGCQAMMASSSIPAHTKLPLLKPCSSSCMASQNMSDATITSYLPGRTAESHCLLMINEGLAGQL
ncbi:hypothetical protein A0H81_10290 [Grifola frondosa]|uniref:Uncharacterized protein n=1 Tax=Grifola frondosa TaxID=5627 RepID=A0A1C7LYQ8_GRIFR|nr:hypothetical protein A0H81_10290 [Grifola frondosa]